MSIYSERVGSGGDDPSKRYFEWRYRVKNRDHIPAFFQNSSFSPNVSVVHKELDPIQRFSTPEKLTYHLKIEDQHHDIEITFLDEMLKEKQSAGGASATI